MKTRSIHFRKQGLNLRTREEWLQRMLDALRPCFDKIGHPIPDQVRVSCSWPEPGGPLTLTPKGWRVLVCGGQCRPNSRNLHQPMSGRWASSRRMPGA